MSDLFIRVLIGIIWTCSVIAVLYTHYTVACECIAAFGQKYHPAGFLCGVAREPWAFLRCVLQAPVILFLLVFGDAIAHIQANMCLEVARSGHVSFREAEVIYLRLGGPKRIWDRLAKREET